MLWLGAGAILERVCHRMGGPASWKFELVPRESSGISRSCNLATYIMQKITSSLVSSNVPWVSSSFTASFVVNRGVLRELDFFPFLRTALRDRPM